MLRRLLTIKLRWSDKAHAVFLLAYIHFALRVFIKYKSYINTLLIHTYVPNIADVCVYIESINVKPATFNRLKYRTFFVLLTGSVREMFVNVCLQRPDFFRFFVDDVDATLNSTNTRPAMTYPSLPCPRRYLISKHHISKDDPPPSSCSFYPKTSFLLHIHPNTQMHTLNTNRINDAPTYSCAAVSAGPESLISFSLKSLSLAKKTANAWGEIAKS